MIKAYFNKRTLIFILELIVIAIMLFSLSISLYAVFAILFHCFSFDLCIDLQGILFFLKQFKSIREVLAATLAIIGLFFIIERINLMSDSNYSTAREAWKKEFDSHLKTNIGLDNPYMEVYFIQLSDQLFRYLIKRNFIIYNKLALRIFFFRYIQWQVLEFEKGSKGYIINGGGYTNPDVIYSLDEAKKVMEYLFRLSHYNKTINFDFESMYRKYVKKFAKKNIRPPQLPS